MVGIPCRSGALRRRYGAFLVVFQTQNVDLTHFFVKNFTFY
jgi:hypothetical protein